MAVNLLNQLPVYKENARGRKQIDDITEAAPILQRMPFEKSTDGLFHKITRVEQVDSFGINKPMDAPITGVTMSRSIEQITLGIIDALLTVGVDYASQIPGNAAGYFKQQTPVLLRKLGMDYETATLYQGYLPYALQMNAQAAPGDEVIFDAGGVTSTNYSIIAVRYSEGEFGGIYDPAMFDRDALVKEDAVTGGKMYLDKDNRPVYGMTFKGHLGNLMATKRNVGAIVNISAKADATAGGLTPEMIEHLLLSVRVGTPGKTYLLCHPQVRVYLNKIGKTNHIQTSYSGDRKVDAGLDSWGGAEIISSYNFLPGTEARIIV